MAAQPGLVLQRESGTVLLERTCDLLRLPAAASVLLFLVITIAGASETVTVKKRLNRSWKALREGQFNALANRN